MTRCRRRPLQTDAIGEDTEEDVTVASVESEVARHRLRQRWELASVLNFLNVFEPVIGSKIKVSAEEIETAIIEPNGLLAQLHMLLLKGIPPVSKALNGTDAWVMVLCKKLSTWWPWVAEGDIPLTAANGGEISRYKQLEPIARLQMLKALCEVRAEQDDAVSYINDAVKSGTELSCFRKDKLGGDGNGTAYWYDGNAIIGYRLYKEVNEFKLKQKVKGRGTIPAVSSHWETLATNLKELHKVREEFSSSEVKLEVAVSKAIEAEAIPILEKLQKKKERAIKQQQRQEKLLNGFEDYGITRSCRNRRPVSYTFDEYDKAIEEAIQLTKKRKTTKEQRRKNQQSECREVKKNASNQSSESETSSGDGAANKCDSVLSDIESDKLQEVGAEDGGSGKESEGKTNDAYDSHSSNSSDKSRGKNAKLHSQKQIGSFANKPRGSCHGGRLAGMAGHPVSSTKSPSAKNRLRQRPIPNTALESAVVPDSEDENSSANGSTSSGENSSPASDTDGSSDSQD